MRRIAESESSQRFLDFFERTLDTFSRILLFKICMGTSISAGNDHFHFSAGSRWNHRVFTHVHPQNNSSFPSNLW